MGTEETTDFGGNPHLDPGLGIFKHNFYQFWHSGWVRLMNLTYTTGNSISDYDIIHTSGLGRGLRSPSAYEMKTFYAFNLYFGTAYRLVLTWFD